MKSFKKLLMVFAVFLAVALCAQPMTAGAGEIEDSVALLIAAEKNLTPVPALSKTLSDTSPEYAYKVQNAYVAERLKSDKIAGYKGAMTSEALMKVFNSDGPAIAALFDSGIFADGTAIKLFRAGIMLEEEIGYRFTVKIDAPLADVASLKAAIGTIFPAIEVPLVAFESMKGLNAIDMIAANVGSYGCIVGKEIPLGDTDVNAITVKLTLNGEDYNSGAGTDALGDQWNTLLGLVNMIIENGYVIEPGQFIISGAMGKMLPAKPGTYSADFGDFGTINFTAAE